MIKNMSANQNPRARAFKVTNNKTAALLINQAMSSAGEMLK